MRKLRQGLHIIGLIVVGVLALFAFGGQRAQAATLDDGIYVVPTKIIKANSTATSTANQFFGDYAAVRITDDQTTVLLTSNGAQYIKSMTIAGQKATLVKTVNGQAIYQVNLTKPASPLPATYSLTTPVGKMTESARLVLSWAKAEKDNTSTTMADLLKQTAALTATAASSSSAVSVPESSTATKTATSTAKSTTTAPTTQYWKYQVLKADTMSPSDANQYYTHTAKVTPNQNGYRVTLTVSYAKSLKLGPKAVVPKSVDGVAVPASRVTYGQSGQNYTMTYWFDIQHTSELTAKLIPGKIHVTVPAMNISETFPVRFRFATSGSADQATAAAVAALPTTKNKQSSARRNGATTPVTAPHAAKATLPATGEATGSWAILGLIGLSVSGSLLAWEAKRHAQD